MNDQTKFNPCFPSCWRYTSLAMRIIIIILINNIVFSQTIVNFCRVSYEINILIPRSIYLVSDHRDAAAMSSVKKHLKSDA